LTTEILGDRDFEYFIADWKLIPASGGLFEVTVNGELIFSKKNLKRHANPGEIKAVIWEKIQAIKQAKGITWEHLPDEDD